jgi:hypothetical protein
MKRTITRAHVSIILLMIMMLMIPGDIQVVNAQTNPVSIWIGLMTPDAPGTICIGKRIVLEYYVVVINNMGSAPNLVPMETIKVDFSAQLGKVAPSSRQHAVWTWNQTLTSNFSYTAQKAGKESITIKASMGNFTGSIQLNLTVRKCKASVNFNHQKTITQEMVVIEDTYSGIGTIQVDDNDQVSGNGTQTIWSSILPFSADGGSCVQDSPWEGSSDFSFSGEISEDGNILASMFLEPLELASTTLTCSGEDFSYSMPFPGYTLSECQVQLDGFDFDAGSIDIHFDCPGEEPYIITLTIIPRSE